MSTDYTALVGTHDEPGLLDEHFMGVQNGIIFVLCKRCPNVQFVARDLDGDQTGLTLGELVQSALEHERDCHPGGES